MKPELFHKLIDEMVEHPPEVLRLHYSGESTVHPKFAELAMYARRRLPNVWLQMNTGGLLWTTDDKRRAWLACGIDKLTFSIEANRWLHDGLDADGKPWDTTTKREDVHATTRKFVIHPHRAGAPWDLTAGNLLKTAVLLAQMKAEAPKNDPVHRTNLFIQHLVPRELVRSQMITNGNPSRENAKMDLNIAEKKLLEAKKFTCNLEEAHREHEVAMATYSKSLGIPDTPFFWELEMSSAFWNQFGVQAQWVPVASIGGQVDNAVLVNQDYKRRPMSVCREVYTNFVISWDGKVAPCCVDHAFSLLPGLDLNRMSILEAWRHPALSGLRERHREMKGIPDKCALCLASA